MPKRNDKRDTAKAEYIKRRRSGEKVNLKDLAEKLGVTYGTVRNWKRIDQWDDAMERKRGGQPGNKNSRGKRNAKGNPGGGAPNGNTNAEKDGAYSTVHGSITQMDYGKTDYTTYAAKRVAKLVVDQDKDTRKLRLGCRPLAAPKTYCPYIYAADVVG